MRLSWADRFPIDLLRAALVDARSGGHATPLADIGAQLYVSRNTVRSHAAAIYRKLGTKSRAEAVDRLRQARLISEQHPG